MTSHPPSGPPSVPPSGPPSGPLSGPDTRPGTAGPPPPPAPPPGGSGGGSGGSSDSGVPGGGGSGKGPWWRSVPKVASVAAVLVAAVALAVVLAGRPDGGKDTTGSGGGEVFLQNASATGPDPFTRSTARTGAASAPPASLPPRTSSATPQVSGASPGLYGGTRSAASCDVERQVRYLADQPAKNAAFASVVGVSAGDVPGYLRSLTPLRLRADTRVTNHGFRNGAATAYQAVLQSGTAVMVDKHGVPRVRCACGNPLTGPVAQKAPRTTGTPWRGYRSDQVVAVAPSATVVDVFVVYDPQDGSWFARRHGDTGQGDRPTSPPPPPSTVPPSTPPADSTPPPPPDASPTGPASSPPAPPPSAPPTGDTPPPGTSAPPTESAPVTPSSAVSSGPASVPATLGPTADPAVAGSTTVLASASGPSVASAPALGAAGRSTARAVA